MTKATDTENKISETTGQTDQAPLASDEHGADTPAASQTDAKTQTDEFTAKSSDANDSVQADQNTGQGGGLPPHDGAADEPDEIYPSGIWMRALHMVILAILFGVAETVLCLMALLQFGWMLFAKARNPTIAHFGAQLSDWLRHVARFQTGATDDKPFPWSQV